MANLVGLGHFLGGVADGYKEMARIQAEKERLMLESQSLNLQQQNLAQSAEQFRGNQALAQQELTQRLGISQADLADRAAGRSFDAAQSAANRSFALQQSADEHSFRLGLAQQDQMAQRDLSMQDYNRNLVARKRITPQDALVLTTLQDLAKKLPADQGEALLQSIRPMLGGSGSTAGGTVMSGIENPYANFYRGGILGR